MRVSEAQQRIAVRLQCIERQVIGPAERDECDDRRNEQCAEQCSRC